MTDIPEVLREFIRPDEDDDTSIRLPAGTTTLTNDEASVFFSGFSGPIPAGEWIGNPSAELPVVTYADITRLLGTQGPKSQPAVPQEHAPEKEQAASNETSLSTPTAPSTPAPAVEDALPPLTPEDREKLYERLRNNVPEPLQKEHRWVLLYDTGKKRKMPIGGHPSATMNLEQAIDAHRNYKGRGNNAPAIGYSTGGKMSYGPKREIPPDPHCIWLDYDDLKDADGNTIAAQEIIDEIENLRKYGAYVEISMSGKGIHVCLPKPRYYDAQCKGIIRDTHQPEVFGNGQYVAVTGSIYGGDTLPDWPAFDANPFAAKVVRSIITREGGWKKREPDIYDTQEGADNRVIETWQKIDPKPTGVEPR